MSTNVNNPGSSQSNINASQVHHQSHAVMSSQTTMPNSSMIQTPSSVTSNSLNNSIPLPVHNTGPVQQQSTSATKSGSNNSENPPTQVLTRPRLQDLVREIDSTEQLDEEVEELLLQIADEFVENTVNSACLLAKHRHANTIEVKDVQLYLERTWNMWIPGFGTDELRPYKRAPVTEAHKHRLALIRKSIKKY